MKKNFIATTIISMLMVSCQPAPAIAAGDYTVKQMMREHASLVCDLADVFEGTMDECVEIISEDYYDAAMMGAHMTIKGKVFTNELIVEHTIKHLDCDETILTCQVNRQQYASWLSFGINAAKEGDDQLKQAAELYYESMR